MLVLASNQRNNRVPLNVMRIVLTIIVTTQLLKRCEASFEKLTASSEWVVDHICCVSAGYENYTRLKTEVDSSAELLMQAVRKPSGKKDTGIICLFLFFFFLLYCVPKFVFWLIVLALASLASKSLISLKGKDNHVATCNNIYMSIPKMFLKC